MFDLKLFIFSILFCFNASFICMYDCLAISLADSCRDKAGGGNGSLLIMSFLISFLTSSSVFSILGCAFGCAFGIALVLILRSSNLPWQFFSCLYLYERKKHGLATFGTSDFFIFQPLGF